ncbi:MAG TPA: hypothetical protein PLZ75_08910, partial [Bacteroidales bacterium]|nr:hypothetical protein [Bacteroidales bacterium]
MEKKYVLLQNELASVYSREGKELSPDSISGAVFDEILTTVSSYLALFRRKEDGRFYITGLNSKVEETELIDKDEVAGKPVESTPLS